MVLLIMVSFRRIVVAGTPGVGKSTVSKKLAGMINAVHVDLSKLAVEKKLYQYYDEERDSYVIDEDKLVDELKRIMESFERVVVDTHYPEIIPSELIDVVFILRLHPLILEKRLSEKGWSWNKIRENVLAEILSVVAVNCLEKFGESKIYEIDTTGKTVDDVLNNIMDILENPSRYSSGVYIDWVSTLRFEDIIRYERDHPG